MVTRQRVAKEGHYCLLGLERYTTSCYDMFHDTIHIVIQTTLTRMFDTTVKHMFIYHMDKAYSICHVLTHMRSKLHVH